MLSWRYGIAVQKLFRLAPWQGCHSLGRRLGLFYAVTAIAERNPLQVCTACSGAERVKFAFAGF